MKSSSGYEIYHNTLSACLEEVERYVQSKGYELGDYFPVVNHVAYGQTERTSLEMLKDGRIANTLAIQIYRMDSGRYELNCYPVRKFAKGDIVGRTMHEFKRGQLHSSSGEVVTNPKQAIAIGLSKERRGKYGTGGKILFYTDEQPYGVLRGTSDGTTAKLSSIEIKPRFKAMGYGTAMVSKFEKWAKETGAKNIEIDAYKKSLKFWENVGYTLEPEFQVIGGHKQDYKTGIKKLYKTGGKILWAVKKGDPDWKEQVITENEEHIENAKKWATENGFDRFRIQVLDLSTPPDFKKTFKTGGYTRPAYNLKTTGNYLFRTNKGTFNVTSYLFERENDTEDALEIQDDLRGTIGSVIIKNSAWKNLSSGKSVKARSSKGDYYGTLVRVGDNVRPQLKFSGGGSTDEGIDLFEEPENVPPQVMAILNKYAEGIEDGDYNAMGDAQNELEEIGYTFDYYVDGSAFDLRPLGTKGKTQDYGTGGGVKTLKVGDQYLYTFNNKVYEVLGVGEKQVAICPLPIGSYWNTWIVSKPLMEKWVKNKIMVKQK
jgi:GNAT superfamily N-acetyltransferase